MLNRLVGSVFASNVYNSQQIEAKGMTFQLRCHLSKPT